MSIFEDRSKFIKTCKLLSLKNFQLYGKSDVLLNIFTDYFNLKVLIRISQCAYQKSFMFQFSQKVKIDFENFYTTLDCVIFVMV